MDSCRAKMADIGVRERFRAVSGGEDNVFSQQLMTAISTGYPLVAVIMR